MKCANCSESALYEYRITKLVSQFYCGTHLPKFLDARRRAGQLGITEHHTAEHDAALAALATPPVALDEQPRKRKKNAGNS